MLSRQLLVPVALAATIAGCSTRTDEVDSATIDTALARETAGDLTGAPTIDTARRTTTGPRADTGSKRPPASPSTTTPERGKTTRDPDLGRDGNREQVPEVPPIHRTPYPGPGQPNPPAANDRIAALVAEIRSLARTGGCTDAGDCRSIAIGYKACGGPRDYVVYCATTTNVATLRARAAELERLEREAARGMVSDCQMVTAPTVSLGGGVCRASGRTAEPLY
jgi:hypothetical protein